MILKEKERAALEDLQTQEKSCIEKYGRYAQQAKDPELKNLFQQHKEKFGFFLIRACSHKMLVRIFVQSFYSNKAETCRHTCVRQEFLTLLAWNYAEKTCFSLLAYKFYGFEVIE